MTSLADGTGSEDEALLAAAEAVAAHLAAAAPTYETRRDRRRQERIARLLDDERGRTFLLALTDEVVRIRDRQRAARRFHDLVTEAPLPRFATGLDRVALWIGGRLTPRLAWPIMPLALARLRREFAGIVLPAAPRAFERHRRRRADQGIRLNVNLLGEAVLGEGEALARQQAILELLRRPGVDYVSVKISAICAQLDVLAFDDSVERIVERLRPILLEAARSRPARFVNLDMEEYRDLHLTLASFRRLLDEPALEHLDAGIVLQAYLPDAHDALVELCRWATERHRRTGASIKVRIVKGANLAMERVDAELHGWPQAPFATKAEVDASFKRLLDVALRPEHAGAVRVGVASHNLFDLAWALVLRTVLGAEDRVELEMLEGMADPQALAVRALAGDLLLYAPIVRAGDFEAAVAYLVRRLDENTAPENFLRDLYSLRPGTPAWIAQLQRFRDAVAARHLPPDRPRRGRPIPVDHEQQFVNEPDTDATVAANRARFSAALEASPWPDCVLACVDGGDVAVPLSGVGIDPFEPGVVLYRYVEADEATVERAVGAALRAAPAWQSTPPAQRRVVLHRIADVMAADRATAVATMAADAGKTVAEGDPEVSEAIDLARYYGDRALDLDDRFEPYRVVVVASPWNFPYAIPAGGVLAALAAGSAVILKPAPETVLTAALLARQCWKAGVPGDVLQFVPCADAEPGQRLVTHPDVDAVILTGAWDTARRFLGWSPSLALHAETSGKNAVVVTAAADVDDAIRDIVRSAFGHAGQKCSAASLAIVEAPLHDDGRFLERLADAVRTLRVGPATDMATQVGPLIRPPEGPLQRQLTQLDGQERWLVRPEQVGGNPHLWRPGVKVGVAPGSELHLTECFGPVLGVLRADDLDHAIALQNQPAYGLTGGIQSLDRNEVATWLDRVEVGNAYVNRHITGAIVQRQPFGGWKRSAVGPGVKAGGPSYVASLGHWPVERAVLQAEVACARTQWPVLAEGTDATGLLAEANVLRLRPVRDAVLRAGPAASPAEVRFTLAIAEAVGITPEVSTASPIAGLPAGAVVEPDDTFVERLRRRDAGPTRRVRLLGTDPAVTLGLLDDGYDLDTTPVAGNGEVELLRWAREQAVSATRHRHGNLLRDG